MSQAVYDVVVVGAGSREWTSCRFDLCSNHCRRCGSGEGFRGIRLRWPVDLFNFGMNGDSDKAFELYRWFLPLLRMDTVTNFVQLIKLVQAELGMGNTRVRAPRLELVGEELAQTRKTICAVLRSRPQPAYAFPNGK